MHRLLDARAWMNKNAELQEKFNDGRLFDENQKIRDEKAQIEKELGEWQNAQKAIKANSASEDLSKLSPEELVRKINTLHEANDLLIKAVEVTRSRLECPLNSRYFSFR